MKNMLGIALRDVRGLLNDLTEKLCGEDGEIWLEAFKKFLRKENSWKVGTFKVWKTIKLGTGLKTDDAFRKALKAGGHYISDWANDILGKPAFKASKTEMEVGLMNVSVAELGFKNGAKLSDIYKRAQELGLELCPAEVGPQLCLQYKDQPNGERLLIGMKPITDSDGDLGVFGVERGGDDGSWLGTYCGDPDGFWRGSSWFLFVSSRK